MPGTAKKTSTIANGFAKLSSAVLLLFLAGALTKSFGQELPTALAPQQPATQFRVDVTPVAGGAEFITIWAKISGDSSDKALPLLSLVRHSLGDDDQTNDLFRQLWVYTYTRPSLSQRAAALVPFLYRRVGNKSAKGVPPAIIDLSNTEQETWQRLFRSGLTQVLLGQPLAKFSADTYRRSSRDYRQAHLIRALTILSLYEHQGATSALTAAEVTPIEAGLMLTEKPLGGLVDAIHLQQFKKQQVINWRDLRGHNWELLRQQAESSGLYFEPLALPDGSVTHAMLWMAQPDLQQRGEKRFDGRFLNIKNPWTDNRLLRWRGYTEEKDLAVESRAATMTSEESGRVEMIPLALYGLDFPKVPALLVDFRDGNNPKKRELSRRVIDDVASNVLSLSKFGNVYYFVGRTAFDFVTSQRGIDINQPSRLRAYSQLTLLHDLNPTVSPEWREALAKQLDEVSSNPLESDMNAERKLAVDQYQALSSWVNRADGLPAPLARERGEEMTKFAHGSKKRMLLRLANIFSAGLYTHREKMSPEKLEQLNKERQLAY